MLYIETPIKRGYKFVNQERGRKRGWGFSNYLNYLIKVYSKRNVSVQEGHQEILEIQQGVLIERMYQSLSG